MLLCLSHSCTCLHARPIEILVDLWAFFNPNHAQFIVLFIRQEILAIRQFLNISEVQVAFISLVKLFGLLELFFDSWLEACFRQRLSLVDDSVNRVHFHLDSLVRFVRIEEWLLLQTFVQVAHVVLLNYLILLNVLVNYFLDDFHLLALRIVRDTSLLQRLLGLQGRWTKTERLLVLSGLRVLHVQWDSVIDEVMSRLHLN